MADEQEEAIEFRVAGSRDIKAVLAAQEVLSELGLMGKGAWVKARPAMALETVCDNCGQDIVWRPAARVLGWVHKETLALDCDEADITYKTQNGSWWESD
jgi:hypothetical protein